MADNFGGSENIYYEENSNIVLIDPNSVRDSNGVKKDRVIKQENLVMYANLIAKSVPRTKLAVGQDLESSVNNTTIASINFLKPTDKNTFDTSYTDEFTGAGSTQGQGINQIKFNNGQNPQQTNFVDTQTLGIRDINVDIKFNGVPTVTMTLVDVQGRSLFQTGGNSPYSVFLYYPYPLFELVLKGFYGKAIKYELMLLNFQASFEAATGNYVVNLKFIARTSAMLDDIRLGYLFALPHMYNQYSVPNVPTVNTTNSATASVQQNGTGVTTEVTVDTTSKGYSKIKQVFEEYKRRGLIDKNVPVLTLNEMSIKLTKYTEFLNDEFDKLDFTNIVALERYKQSLDRFSNTIVEWGETNLESNKVLVLVSVQMGGVGNAYGYFLLLRGSTSLIVGNGAGGSQVNTFISSGYIDGVAAMRGGSNSYLDSPNTTSATTYKIQFASGNSNAFYINRQSSTDNGAYIQFPVSSITLIEIAA